MQLTYHHQAAGRNLRLAEQQLGRIFCVSGLFKNLAQMKNETAFIAACPQNDSAMAIFVQHFPKKYLMRKNCPLLSV